MVASRMLDGLRKQIVLLDVLGLRIGARSSLNHLHALLHGYFGPGT